MGYYSFYRIIKDIFTTIFGRKFFRILLIFVLILLLSTFLIKTGVFAATTTTYTDIQNFYENNILSHVSSDFFNNAIFNSGSGWANRYVYWQKYYGNEDFIMYVSFSGSSDPSSSDWGFDEYALDTSGYIIVAFYDRSDYSVTQNDTGDVWWGLYNVAYESVVTEYLGAIFVFTADGDFVDYDTSIYDTAIKIPVALISYVSSTATADIIEAIDSGASDIVSAIDNLNDNLMSTDYDEEQASDTMSSVTSSTADIDDSETSGLFTAIFNKFSALIDSDSYDTVETISIPVPFTDKSLTLNSDLISSRIEGSFINTLLSAFWYYLFRYVFI